MIYFSDICKQITKKINSIDVKISHRLFSIFLLLFLLTPLKQVVSQNNIKEYIFIGHSAQSGSPNSIDYRAEALDFEKYTGVWLGGDVCTTTLLKKSTTHYLDSLFNLGNPESHWTLGNHDWRIGNIEWYEEITGRPTYYAYSSNGLTRIIMNTNLVPTNCEMLDEQYEMISNVCDTITESSYLILIVHHGLWRGVPSIPAPINVGHSDLVYWNSNCYDVNSTFLNSIYPKLIEVKARGIEVYYLYGDMGAQRKKFNVISDDSIHFIGCGLHSNDPADNVLIFTYDLDSKQLQTDFHNLDSLYQLTK